MSDAVQTARPKRPRLNYHVWTADDDAVVRTGYLRGDSVPAIASALGVSISAVHNRARILSQPHRRKSRSLEQRFWDYVSCEPNSGCWLWDGSYDRKGYGQLRLKKSSRYATHIALALDGRPVPAGMLACHHCDIPSCVNPAHLFVATAQQNTADMMAKGRNRPFDDAARLGSRNPTAKLTESDIPEIRRRLERGETLRSVGADYGVSEANLSGIRLGKTWRHVE